MVNAERCVCCGEIIPEGMMVCPNCLTASVHAEKGELEMNIHEATEIAYKNGYEAGKPKWIPVTERLPEDRQQVLGWCDFGRIYHDILHFANCLENISCDLEGSKYSGFYDYDSEWGYYEVTNITHWMPLPEPPKED